MKKALVFLAALTLAFPAAGAASDFGCQVFLCLGAKGKVSECVPIMEKLFKSLAKGKPWPTCEMAEAQGGRLKRGVEYYEPCASGYTMYSVDREGSYRETSPSSRRGWYGDDRVCRRLVGHKLDYEGQPYPVYEAYPAKRRSEPYWAEISVNGYTNRTYYSLRGY